MLPFSRHGATEQSFSVTSNEFTKKFNETELLRAMYEASYNENIYAVILDEMNIARVEYYFAEMLSILEMPSRDEWVVDIIRTLGRLTRSIS